MKKILILCFSILLFSSSQTTFANDIEVDGVQRNYYLFIPSQKPQSIVFILHQLDGNANQMKMLGFEQYAMRDGDLLVYPEAINGRWEKTDLLFLKQLKDVLSNEYDVQKTYLVGASSGGMLAHGFAAQYSNEVAAIATVSSTLPEGLSEPLAPVSVLMINGTHDPIIPFQGNSFFAPSVKAAQYWIQENEAQLVGGNREPFFSSDGTLVNQERFESSNGKEVFFYVIEGGGHTWPGGPILPEAYFGKTCLHVSATRIIWDFFRRH